jgi:hypothetical protein
MIRFTLDFDSLKAWCGRQQYDFRENPELGQLAILYALLGEPAPLLILPQPARGMVMFVMRQPFAVPAERRAALLEAVTLLNSTSFMGAWIVNRQTGELYFRVTVPALDTEYSDEGLVHVARVVVGTSEKAAAGLRAVALEGAAPETAVPPVAE